MNPAHLEVGPRQRRNIAGLAPNAIAAAWTIAAVLAGGLVRWLTLGKQSLWWDEGFSLWASRLRPAEIVRYAQSSDTPPLYFLIQHYWNAVFGDSEYALRALSAFFGTLSMVVFYFLVKKLLKDSMAIAVAMWLFAGSMMQIWYSQEARFYAMLTFLMLVGLYSLILFLERRSAISFGVIVSCFVISLYTHNMVVFYVFALNAVWLIYPSERTFTQRIREAFLA